jgi:hypothetical protein
MHGQYRDMFSGMTRQADTEAKLVLFVLGFFSLKKSTNEKKANNDGNATLPMASALIQFTILMVLLFVLFQRKITPREAMTNDISEI